MKKRLLLLFCIFCLFVTVFSLPAFADTPPAVYVDGQRITFDTDPVIVSGTTLVPMRGIFEAIGATVTWEQDTKTAVGVKDGNTVRIQIGSNYGYKNGVAISLLQPAQIRNSRTLVPLRFISESLDCSVDWDGVNRIITITTVLKLDNIPQPQVQPQQEKITNTNSGTNWSGVYYITKTGKKYHYLNNCGNGTYYAVTWDEVKARGLTPCEKCVH